MASIKLNVEQAYALTCISHTYSNIGYWIRQMEDTVKSARHSFDSRTALPTGGYSMMEYNATVNRLRAEIDMAFVVFANSVHETHVYSIIASAQQLDGFPATFREGDVINYKA